MVLIHTFSRSMKQIFIILMLFISSDCIAQRLISINKIITIKEKFGLKNITFTETLPIDRENRQSIIEIKCNPKADNLYIENGDMYAIWDVSNFDIGDSITVDILLSIHNYDLEISTLKPTKIKDQRELEKYLVNAKNLNIEDKGIRKIANELKHEDEIETVKNAFSFVVDHLDYHVFKKQSRSAKKALSERKGDCTEYSELMIALCRANNIPARIVSGYTLHPRKTLSYHNWVEVYLSKNGWTPFDPTFADAKNPTTSFSNMDNVYAYISNSRTHQHHYREYKSKYQSTLKKLDIDVEVQWEDITLKKNWELRRLYKENDHQKTKELLDTLLIASPNKSYFLRLQAITQARLKNYEVSLKLLQKAWAKADNEFNRKSVLYAFSNYFALKGDTKSSLTYLEKAIDLGYNFKNHILEDKDFETISNLPEFKEIVNQIKD